MRILIGIVGFAALALGTSASLGSATTAAAPRDLPGRPSALVPRVTYRASLFPLALRLTPPDASWGGAQWKTDRNDTPPYYGFVALGQGGGGTAAPNGVITLESSHSRTPSVAQTVANLRNRGTGATYDPASPVKLAGYSGIQFDGRVVGRRRVFIPFSPPTTSARYRPDAVELGAGDAFRIIVLNVRGKTVFILIDDAALPAEEFPDFLVRAETILKTLRFPTGGIP